MAHRPLFHFTFYRLHHSMEDAFFENNRVDALAMERLTGSPYVIGIYGYCSMTVIQEFAGRQISDQKLNSTESLDLAIQVASGIRAIHSIPDDNENESALPSLVHNDINLANILVTDDGRPVLNDFNIAVLIMKNRTSGVNATCPFYARFPNPQWRGPEEQIVDEEDSDTEFPEVDEKIDIYAMGNVLYRLVAGGSPWKIKGKPKLSQEEKKDIARRKKYNGSMPDLPEDFNLEDLTDPITAALHKAMERCYSSKPENRPSAKELVEFLETTKSQLNREI